MNLALMPPSTKAEIAGLSQDTKDKLMAWLNNAVGAMTMGASMIVGGDAVDAKETASIVAHAGREFLHDFDDLLNAKENVER